MILLFLFFTEYFWNHEFPEVRACFREYNYATQKICTDGSIRIFSSQSVYLGALENPQNVIGITQNK